MIRRKSQTSSEPKSARTIIRKKPRKASRKAVGAPRPPIPPLGTPVGTRIASGPYKGCYKVGYKERPKNSHPFFRIILMPHSLRVRTTYIIDYKNQKFVCMMTTQPNGTVVAWDVCRRCHLFIGNCVCTEIKAPDYIVNWMPKKSVADEIIERAEQMVKSVNGKPKKLIKKAKNPVGKRLVRKN